MRWTAHIRGGPRRVNHAAVCIGDRIYSFGGYCSTETYKDWEPIPVHVLNTNTLRWSVVNYKDSEVVPFQIYGHTTVAYGDKVYMWGGRNNVVACVSLSCFDTNTLEWTIPAVTGMIPFAKDGHTACVIRDKLYIFGGFEYHLDQYSQDIHCLCLDTMEWQLIDATGPAPSPRDFHTAVAVGDRMYVFGGRGDIGSTEDNHEEIYCSQVYYLDTVANKWVNVNVGGTRKPEGRRSHSAWVYDNHMYIFGGVNSNTKTHFNDLFRYSIKDNYWELINVQGSVPCKRRRQACIMHKDKVYLFGGTSPRPVQVEAVDGPEEIPEQLVDNDDLHVLDYYPTLKTLGILMVLEHRLDQAELPLDVILDIRTMMTPNRITRTNHSR